MPTLVLRRDTLPKTAAPSGIPTARATSEKTDNSIHGVLIFSGVGFSLTILAVVFQYLQLLPPYF